MAPEKKRLDPELWATLRPKCEAAAAYSTSSITAWAKIAAEAVSAALPADRRWLLADLRERCFDNGIECPYTQSYLIQLAETHEKVKGNFNRGVPVSVLIEGRNLPDLLKMVEPGITVGRMKAIVTKHFDPKDNRSIEEIEAEQKRHRLDGRERSKRKDHAEKIGNWKLDKADDLLPTLKEEATAYQNAIVRLQAEGAEFSAGDVAVARQAVRNALSTLDALTPLPVAHAA